MTCRIPLTRGLFALVSEADFARLSQFRWRAVKARAGTFYAERITADGRRRQMQREVLDPAGEVSTRLLADHRNGDTLDCRRENLRWASYSLSNLNRRTFKSSKTGFRGVYAMRGWFTAEIRHGRRIYRSSGHASPEGAALAYNEMALRLRGEHARLNIVPGAGG